MLVEFRPAAASPNVHDFRYRFDQHLGLLRQDRRLGQRDTRIESHADQQGSLIEGRQEGLGKKWHGCRSHHNGEGTCRQRGSWPVQHRLQTAPITSLQPSQQFRVAMIERLHARQQVEGEHRRHRHRHHQRGQRRHDESDAERHEQASLHARQCEKRQENQHDDDRCVEDGRTHLHRRMGDQFNRVHPVIVVLGTVFL